VKRQTTSVSPLHHLAGYFDNSAGYFDSPNLGSLKRYNKNGFGRLFRQSGIHNRHCGTLFRQHIFLMTITINKKHRTSNEDRRKVIIAYENGCSPANIAIVLGLKQTTVVGIIKVYSTEGRIGKKPRGGTREGHLTNSNRDSIRAWLDDDCSLSLHAISKRAGMIFPLLCLSTLLHGQLTHFI
jgi:hypothetical protein